MLPTLYLREAGDQLVILALEESCDGRLLCLKAEPGPPLPSGGNAVVSDVPIELNAGAGLQSF